MTDNDNPPDLSKPRIFRGPREVDGVIIRGVLIDDDTIAVEVLDDGVWTREGAPEIRELLIGAELSPEERALLPPD